MDDPPFATRASAPRRPARPARNTRALLTGSPRTILKRLAEGDPLGLRERVDARLRERWLLLDVERVHLRAMALVAHRAGSWSGRPGLEHWLTNQVDAAIDEVRAEAGPGDGPREGPGAADAIAAALGLEPRVARRLQAIFDGRSEAERRIFIRIVLDGEEIGQVAREEQASITEVGRRARVVLEALMRAAEQA